MAQLEIGETYDISDDNGDTIRGTLLKLINGTDGSPVAILDVRIDEHRDKNVWGDFVCVTSYFPGVSLAVFPTANAPIRIYRVPSVPTSEDDYELKNQDRIDRGMLRHAYNTLRE